MRRRSGVIGSRFFLRCNLTVDRLIPHRSRYNRRNWQKSPGYPYLCEKNLIAYSRVLIAAYGIVFGNSHSYSTRFCWSRGNVTKSSDWQNLIYLCSAREYCCLVLLVIDESTRFCAVCVSCESFVCWVVLELIVTSPRFAIASVLEVLAHGDTGCKSGTTLLVAEFPKSSVAKNGGTQYP